MKKPEPILKACALAGYYAAKHHKVIKLAPRIQAMMLRILYSEQEQREATERRREVERRLKQCTKQPTVLISVLPFAPRCGQGQCIDIAPFKVQDVDTEDHHNIVCIWTFLSINQWKPTMHGQLGMSWLEMYAIFHTQGGNIRCKEHDDGPYAIKHLAKTPSVPLPTSSDRLRLFTLTRFPIECSNPPEPRTQTCEHRYRHPGTMRFSGDMPLTSASSQTAQNAPGIQQHAQAS